MTDEPDKREHPVLAADEDPAALRLARAFQQAGDFLPVLKLVEQLAHALEIGRRHFVDQVGLAAHDQHRAPRMVLAPGARPDATSSAAARSIASRRSRISARSRASASASVSPARPRIDEIADLGRGAAAVTRPQATTRFSTLPSRPTSTASARVGAQAERS